MKLAKQAVENYIKTGREMREPQGLEEDFYSRRAGVFVTIYNGKDLRGCIGTSVATQDNLCLEIIRAGESACSRDIRFSPITVKELPELTYEVSVLGELKLVKSKQELDPKKFGVLVEADSGRSGLLLPDIEGVDEADYQLEIAADKGGIDLERDKVKIYIFEVEKHR